MKRRNLLMLSLLSTFGALLPTKILAQASDSLKTWSSQDVSKGFEVFAKTGKMPTELSQWLRDAEIQKREPYQVFDNVWWVGITWVSSWLIKTSDGLVLIDTLHEPFVDRLIKNIETLGFKLSDIKYVLMTHGHFDHVGGYYKLKPLMPNAHFAMTQKGWQEAFENSQASEGKPNAWKMLHKTDLIMKDGDEIFCGDSRFVVLETPGHTWGTASYLYEAKWGDRRYRCVTVGGLGLNAIESKSQIEAYISSIKRLADKRLNVEVDLTAHPFSTGLTEKIPLIQKVRAPEAHPLVDRNAYLEQLQKLLSNAEALLQSDKYR